ncbi:MAG: ModD protein [Rhodospirillaceae bacterium]
MIGDGELWRLLVEDGPHGDLTTHLLGIGERAGRVRFAARTAMVVSATEEAARLFTLCGARVLGEILPSGRMAPPGTPLLAAEGPAAALHTAWKVAQVLVESCSGIASATRALVDEARAAAQDICVACTRKSFPGTRALALRAIVAGGAVPHRLGLSDSILVFPEHRTFLPPGLSEAVWISRLKAAAPEKKIVAEVNGFDEAQSLARAGIDILQLEKFDPAGVRRVVEAVRAAALPTLVAAAGGINAGNARAYAASGARILVTSAPYHARPGEVQVSFEAA